MSPVASYVVQTVVTLLGVAALALVVLYGARRAGVGRPAGPLEIVGRLPLDGRRTVFLVRVGTAIYVIGASDAGLVKLGETTDAALFRDAPSAVPFPDAPSAVPFPGAPSAVPFPGAPSAVPFPGAPSAVPFPGAPSAVPFPGAPSAVPFPGAPSAVPFPGAPSAPGGSAVAESTEKQDAL